MKFEFNRWVFAAGVLICGAVVYATYANMQIGIKKAEIEAIVNAQKEVERIKIEEAEATKRTRERMQWIPWYVPVEETEPAND